MWCALARRLLLAPLALRDENVGAAASADANAIRPQCCRTAAWPAEACSGRRPGLGLEQPVEDGWGAGTQAERLGQDLRSERACRHVEGLRVRARLCHPLARRWLQRRRLLWPGPRRRAAAWRPASSSSTVAFVDVTLRGLCIGTRIEASSSVSARAAQLLFLCCGVKDVLR